MRVCALGCVRVCELERERERVVCEKMGGNGERCVSCFLPPKKKERKIEHLVVFHFFPS